LGCLALGLSVWDSLGFLDLGGYFLPHFREVFNYYLKYFLMPFHFVFFFWDSYDSNIGAFNIVPEVSEFVLTFSNSFPPPLSASFISTILSSSSLILSSASVILLLIPPESFLSQSLHYSLLIDSSLFFFRSLLNISCIFSILVSNLLIYSSILFSRFWMICTIIILNSFSSRLPITSSFVWFVGHLSCSFTCCIFLCLFILFGFLCLGFPFCRLEVHDSSLLWVGLDQ